MLSRFISRLKQNYRENSPYFIVLVLIIAFLIIMLWQRVFISVKAGEGGVLYYRFFGGTITDYVYPEGMHIIAPWDEMHIYNARVQTILHEFDVLTSRGLPINLRIAIRFYPEYEMLGLLHQNVGPDYVNVIMIPQVESVLRKNLGQYDPEDVYTNKDGLLTTILVNALEEAGQKYVRIDDIIIRSMEMPEEVKKAIEHKLVEEQRFKSYHFILQREEEEAKRKEIEASGINRYQSLVNQTLNDQMLMWQGIQATLDLAKSNNAKIVLIGNHSTQGLPLMFADFLTTPPLAPPLPITTPPQPPTTPTPTSTTNNNTASPTTSSPPPATPTKASPPENKTTPTKPSSTPKPAKSP